jgi:hypothetical protein
LGEIQLKDQMKLGVWDSRNSQCKRILELLQSRDFVLTTTIRLIAPQYNARIYELRNGMYDGEKYIIESEYRNGATGYRLVY